MKEKSLNILFLSLSKIDDINGQGIYTDLLRQFTKNNHNVYVVSPVEKRFHDKEEVIKTDKLTVLKVKVGNITKTNMLEKGLSTLFLSRKIKKSMKLHFNDVKFDLIVYPTPPITLLDSVKYIKKRDNAFSYLLLKDIFPDNALDIGVLSNKGITSFVYKYFKRKEKEFYKISDCIGCMSSANLEYILKNNSFISKNKIEINPNSIDLTISNDYNKIDLRDKFNIPINKRILLYGGNLGKPQGIDFLKKVIKSNEKSLNSYLMIIGSGTEFNNLKEFFEENEFTNSILLNSLPKVEYESIVRQVDVGLIFLDHRFKIPNYPSRLLSYMNAKKPIIAATDVNTDIKDLLLDNGFGFWCESTDESKFMDIVNSLDNYDLIKMGEKGYQYMKNNFNVKNSYSMIIEKLGGN